MNIPLASRNRNEVRLFYVISPAAESWLGEERVIDV